MQNTLELTKSQFEQVDKIVRIVTWKYKDWSRMEWDDLRQEGWVKAVGVIRDKGLNFGLIRECIENRCKDLGRYYKRRQNQNPSDTQSWWFETIPTNREKNNPLQTEDAVDPAWSKRNRIGTDFTSELFVQEIRDLFEDGSDELCAVYTGSKNGAEKIQDRIFKFEHSMEIEIADLLGYPSTSSSRYRSMKKRVRSKVSEYMGWNSDRS